MKSPKSPEKAEKSGENLKERKGKGFEPTNWKEDPRVTASAFDSRAQNNGQLLDDGEEEVDDEDFYINNSDLGSESSQGEDDTSCSQEDEDNEDDDDQDEFGDSPIEHAAGATSMENEVNELLQEIQEHAQDGIDEMIQPGTLRSGKRKRDFFGDDAHVPPFRDDLTIVGKSVGSSKGASASSSSK